MHTTFATHDEARGQGSMTRRLAVVCALLLLAGLLALAAAPAQSAEDDLPKITGKLPRFGADAAKALGVENLEESVADAKSGMVMAYPKLDRLYQAYNMSHGPVADGVGIIERDLGTLKLTRVLHIPRRQLNLANGSNGVEWVGTFDYRNDRLLFTYKPTGDLMDRDPGLLNIDLRSLTYVDVQFPSGTVGTAGLFNHISGMEYDESTDTLLVLQAGSHTSMSLSNVLTLSGWTGEELRQGGRLPARAPRPIRACRRDPLNDNSSLYMSPILVAQAPDLENGGALKTWVMVPCYSNSYSTNVVIVRMDRDTALNPNSTQERAVVAPAGVSNWAVDSKHGRMYLINNSSETDAWVYEAASNAFVGIIALSPKFVFEANSLSLGVDETSGRLYGRSFSYGLTITAAAQDPVPQADAYPRLAAAGAFRLAVDPKRNRLFSLPGDYSSDGAGKEYEIIEVPAFRPPPPRENPDSRTADIDEQPGKTVAQYGGNASAYGLRVLLARGVSGAVPSNGSPPVGDVYKNINSYCGFTDREMILARVSKTELSNTSRFARASAVELDNATVIDLGSPSRCDVHNQYSSEEVSGGIDDVFKMFHTTGVLGDLDRAGAPASGTVNDVVGPRTTWDYTAADCSRRDGDDEAGANSKPLVGDTGVDCDEASEITAKAESRMRPVEGLDIRIGRATTSTKVKLDKTKGLVSTATARLEKVQIGDISIGYISNSATSFAKGRKGTAGTEFAAPSLGYVSGPGIPSCTDRCNVDQVIRAINTVLAGRAELRRVAPEQAFAEGSPGGYQAGIIKSEKQQASDNSLSGDKSVEVPAFELIAYNDNTRVGRARQVYQFAGVRADSHYGIQFAGPGSDGRIPGVGDVIDGATGDIAPALGDLPNGGEPLKVRIPGAGENVIKRTIRQTADYADYSLRIIFNNPREAMVMATVWLLMWGPFVASRRRRALKAVTASKPQGPSL